MTYSYNDCIELQLVDCNCNNCKFMDRDLDLYKKWEDWHRGIALKDFNRNKAKSIFDANQAINNSANESDKRSAEGMLRKAQKMKFQFEKIGLIKYGKCNKFHKEVSFIPNTCQLETQECFEHRRINS